MGLPRLALICTFILLAAGCDTDRIKTLEKDNADLKTQLTKMNLEMQEKCSAAAQRYIKAEWNSPGPDTILFDFNSHYNQARNKCFVALEWHYNIGKDMSWEGIMMVYDAYERFKFADFAEVHRIYDGKSEDRVTACVVENAKCDSAESYNHLIQPLITK